MCHYVERLNYPKSAGQGELDQGPPLWVRSGLMQCSKACPLYPQ